jgi:hypothetical protein
MATTRQMIDSINARLDDLTTTVQMLVDQVANQAHEGDLVQLDTRIQTIAGQLKALVTP